MTVPDPPIIEDSAPEPPERCPECGVRLSYESQCRDVVRCAKCAAEAAQENIMTHKLKIWPEFFGPVRDGLKPFELRIDDRPFEAGDILLLQEWNPENREYTGYDTTKLVTFVLRNAPQFGLQEGCCILGIAPFECGQIAT